MYRDEVLVNTHQRRRLNEFGSRHCLLIETGVFHEVTRLPFDLVNAVTWSALGP